MSAHIRIHLFLDDGGEKIQEPSVFLALVLMHESGDNSNKMMSGRIFFEYCTCVQNQNSTWICNGTR